MRKWRQLLTATSLLLLVGAGCDASGDADMKIDAAVDGIVGDQVAEQAELKAEEQDAAQFDADKAEIDSYGDATYEVK